MPVQGLSTKFLWSVTLTGNTPCPLQYMKLRKSDVPAKKFLLVGKLLYFQSFCYELLTEIYFTSDPPKTVHILQYTCKCMYHLHFEKTGLIHAITNWYFTVNMKVYIPSTVCPVIFVMI